MGTTTACMTRPICMVGYPIWNSIIGKNYEVVSDNAYLIYDIKSRKTALTILNINEYDMSELYCNYGNKTVEIIHAKGIKFQITHVELIYDKYNNHQPIIDIKLTEYSNISSKYVKFDSNDNIEINSCYYFFNSPINYQFMTLSNHSFISKEHIIKKL
jgi:hypothetical protein